jgi:hypothetical protein
MSRTIPNCGTGSRVALSRKRESHALQNRVPENCRSTARLLCSLTNAPRLPEMTPFVRPDNVQARD